MTFAINAFVSPRTAGGVETNLLSLVEALRGTGERFVLLVPPRHADEFPKAPNLEIVPWPYGMPGYAPKRALGPRWEKLRAKSGPFKGLIPYAHWAYHTVKGTGRAPSASRADALLRKHGVSVVHFPFPLRFETSIPFLYEPWDLQHRHYPEFFDEGERRWRDEAYRAGCEKAALVITATRWIKNDIVKQFGIPPGKIAVIPRFPSTPDDGGAVDLPPLPEPFAYYPAMTFPHKNHLAALEAIAALRDEGTRVNLVCSGRLFAPHQPKLEDAVKRLNLLEQVRFLGPVSAASVLALYRRARFLFFPSLFEGLGIPILEAFQHGLPVVASNATCIPEVAGDAALLFDARRPEAIAETLRRALRRPELLKPLRAKGRERLKAFAWERTVETLMACYRKSAGEPLTKIQAAAYDAATA